MLRASIHVCDAITRLAKSVHRPWQIELPKDSSSPKMAVRSTFHVAAFDVDHMTTRPVPLHAHLFRK
jgi:hypothetical protein